MLEAGRALAAFRPSRTVRVVLFAAEENSLSGGTEYARAHTTEAAKLIAAFEADFGTTRVVRSQLLGDPAARDPFAHVASLLAPLGVLPLEDKGYGGADVTPLFALGVPLVDLQQDSGRYFDTHHTANDTFGRIDADALSQAAAVFATTAWGIAKTQTSAESRRRTATAIASGVSSRPCPRLSRPGSGAIVSRCERSITTNSLPSRVEPGSRSRTRGSLAT